MDDTIRTVPHRHYASSRPAAGDDGRVWRELGDWLLLGERVGAERIFLDAPPVAAGEPDRRIEPLEIVARAGEV
jgi:hypothetical protein